MIQVAKPGTHAHLDALLHKHMSFMESFVNRERWRRAGGIEEHVLVGGLPMTRFAQSTGMYVLCGLQEHASIFL